jgi:predicted metal-dependent hydrolase
MSYQSSSHSLPIQISDGNTLRIEIHTSKRARRLRLISGIHGVRAVVPINYNANELENFIAKKRNWIIKTSEYYSRLKERCEIGREPNIIYFLGSKYRFNLVKDKQSSIIVSHNMRLITFHTTDKRVFRKQLQEWYRRETDAIISERLPIISQKLKLQYNRVTIKKQQSRWGSCSKKRNLNFNLLLSAAPLEVIDYVIIHELIHLIEFDHSKRFWQLVNELDPEYKKHKEWLIRYAQVIKIE